MYPKSKQNLFCMYSKCVYMYSCVTYIYLNVFQLLDSCIHGYMSFARIHTE